MTSHYPCNDNSVPALAEKNATRNVIVFDCEEWGIFYQQCSTVQVLAGAGFYFTRTQCKFNVKISIIQFANIEPMKHYSLTTYLSALKRQIRLIQ